MLGLIWNGAFLLYATTGLIKSGAPLSWILLCMFLCVVAMFLIPLACATLNSFFNNRELGMFLKDFPNMDLKLTSLSEVFDKNVLELLNKSGISKSYPMLSPQTRSIEEDLNIYRMVFRKPPIVAQLKAFSQPGGMTRLFIRETKLTSDFELFLFFHEIGHGFHVNSWFRSQQIYALWCTVLLLTLVFVNVSESENLLFLVMWCMVYVVGKLYDDWVISRVQMETHANRFALKVLTIITSFDAQTFLTRYQMSPIFKSKIPFLEILVTNKIGEIIDDLTENRFGENEKLLHLIPTPSFFGLWAAIYAPIVIGYVSPPNVKDVIFIVSSLGIILPLAITLLLMFVTSVNEIMVSIKINNRMTRCVDYEIKH